MIACIIKPGFENVLKFKEEKNCHFKHEFPSVTKTSIDTSKIKRMLNFKFTNLKSALEEIIEFYNSAYKLFPSERRLIAKDVAKNIFNTDEERDALKDFIRTFDPMKN